MSKTQYHFHPKIHLFIVNDVQALADSINRFFQGVAADLRPLDDNCMPPPPDVIPDEFIISQEDVECRLSQIDVHKAPGPDGLPNRLLRDFCSYLAGPVCAIYLSLIHI